MNNNELSTILVEMYNYYYWGTTNNLSFKLDLSINNQGKEVNNFFNRLSKKYNLKSLGVDFLNKFLAFQFAYWLDKNTKRENISLSWIIGKKAIERWESIEDLSNDLYWTNVKLLEKSVDMYEIKSLFDIDEKIYYISSDIEMDERKRFYNTDRGFLNCIERTTLFVKKFCCFKCNYRDDCQKLLKVEYPELYKKRNISNV